MTLTAQISSIFLPNWFLLADKAPGIIPTFQGSRKMEKGKRRLNGYLLPPLGPSQVSFTELPSSKRSQDYIILFPANKNWSFLLRENKSEWLCNSQLRVSASYQEIKDFLSTSNSLWVDYNHGFTSLGRSISSTLAFEKKLRDRKATGTGQGSKGSEH